MTDSPAPRLDTAPTAGSGYAPVSWMAVASVAVGGLFVFLLVALGVSAFARKQPLNEWWLLLLPAVGTVLAFTARRQILSSEGTRIGLGLASAGWWVSVVGGFGFIAYLFGLDYAVRNDAQREFVAWAEAVKAADPANPRDPNLYEAVLKTVPPGARAEVRGPKDYAGMDVAFRDPLVQLRQLDVTRVAGRNRGDVRFTDFGVQAWHQEPTQITCTLAAKMVTPEGEYALLVPMAAELGQGSRQWHVKTEGDGFVHGRSLTRYGWLVDQVEDTGAKFAAGFLALVGTPGGQYPAYRVFVKGETDPAKVDPKAASAADQAEYKQALDGPLFSLPGGAAPSADERARFRQCWELGRVWRPRTVLHSSPDTHAVLRLTDDAVELRVPVELNLSGAGGASAEAARGRLVLRCTDPALLAELKAARAAGGPLTTEPPAGLLSAAPPWRLVRVESDLKPVPQSGPPRGAGGPGGAGASPFGE